MLRLFELYAHILYSCYLKLYAVYRDAQRLERLFLWACLLSGVLHPLGCLILLVASSSWLPTVGVQGKEQSSEDTNLSVYLGGRD